MSEENLIKALVKDEVLLRMTRQRVKSQQKQILDLQKQIEYKQSRIQTLQSMLKDEEQQPLIEMITNHPVFEEAVIELVRGHLAKERICGEC